MRSPSRPRPDLQAPLRRPKKPRLHRAAGVQNIRFPLLESLLMDCNGQARAGSRPPLCAPAPPRGLLFRAALTAPRRSRGNVICAASLRAHRKAEGSGEVAASISKSDTRLTLPPPPPPSRAGGRRVNPRHFLLSKNFSANLPISLDKRPNVCYYNNAGSP